MKTVAMIRLMKVQNQVIKQKPYATKMREIVNDLVARTPKLSHPMLAPITQDTSSPEQKTQRKKRIIVLALGSDRGLAGPFNNNILFETQKFINLHKADEIRLIVAGKKLRDLLRTRKYPIDTELIGIYNNMTFDKVAKIADGYLKSYIAGNLDELYAIYTEFRTTAKQKVVTEQILPIGLEQVSNKELFPPYIYEPDAFTVLEALLPMYYKREAWRIFLESTASEHMARMVAMDMATINGVDMIRELTLSYNKARQESITRELSEISTAAEAFRTR